MDAIKESVSSNCYTNTVVAFVHMPKAAGTTLHSIFNSEYSDINHLASRGLKTLDELLLLDESQLNRLGVIRGHMNFGVHKLLAKPCHYLTILRDPVERVISHYLYLQRATYHPLYEQYAKERFSISDFLTMSLDNDNGQTRALAGVNDAMALGGEPKVEFGACSEEIYEKAVENLKTFTVVGLQDRFDETLILMKRTLGWQTPPVYIRQNVGSVDHEGGDIEDEDISMIKRCNHYDEKLYAFAKELFDDKLLREGASFPLEVEYFKWANKFYQRQQVQDEICRSEIERYKTKLELHQGQIGLCGLFRSISKKTKKMIIGN